MQLVRRHLAWVICGWLACQFTGLAAAPVVLWRVTAAHAGEECDCPLDPGATCPMHHKARDENACKLRSAFGSSEQALFALAGGSGVLPESTVTVSAFVPGAVVPVTRPSAILRAHRPESPPPRA